MELGRSHLRDLVALHSVCEASLLVLRFARRVAPPPTSERFASGAAFGKDSTRYRTCPVIRLTRQVSAGPEKRTEAR